MKVSFYLITFVATTNIVWSAISRPRASAGDGVRPDATVGVGHSAGGGVRLGTKGSVGQGPDATVGVGPGTTVGLGQGTGGGASSGATVGVGQGARGGTSSGTTVGLGQGTGGGTSSGTTVGLGQGTGGGASSDTTVGPGQGTGGGTSSGTTVGLGQGTGGGANLGATVGLGQGTGGGASSGTTVGVGQGTGDGASSGTTVGLGQGTGGGATLSKGGSGVVDASLGEDSSTGLATNFSSGADAVLKTLTTRANKKFKPSQCKSTGFAYPQAKHPDWCVCNFAGACDNKNNALSKDLITLKGFAPQGVDAFKYDIHNPVTICEGSTVGILYDCDARIPLYAATVIYGTYAGGRLKWLPKAHIL